MENQEQKVESTVEETADAKLVKKKKIKKVAGIVIAIGVVCVLLGVLGGGKQPQKSDGKYSAEAATYRDIVVSVSGTGTIQPIDSSTIVGMVTGDILAADFEIGDAVEKDQLLYTIDADKAQTGVEQARLGVQQAQLGYDQALRAKEDLAVKSTVAGQISAIPVKVGDSIAPGSVIATVTDRQNMTLKCAFNSEDAKNIAAGQSATVIMTATGESVPATVKSVSGYTNVGPGGTLVQTVELSVKNPGGITGGMAATAQVGTYACQSGGVFEYAAQTQIMAKTSGTVKEIYVSEGTAVGVDSKILRIDGDMIEDQVKSASIGLENAKLNLKNAEDMLDSYRIKAPISGVVTEKDLNAGDNVSQPGATVMAVVSDLSALTFNMMIDELDIPQVKVGQKVSISVDALPGKDFTGYVDEININGRTANGVTNYPVKVMVENPDASLLPGMNVSAEILIEEVRDALTIPMGAVSRGNIVKVLPPEAISKQDGSIDSTQAVEREVVVGINNKDYVKVESGLEEGEIVLIKGIWVDAPTAQETGEAYGEMMSGV